LPRYPLGAPTDDGFNFPPADDSFLSTPPASPREGETVTPPHTPHDLLRRDVLRAVSWDEGSPAWFGGDYAPGGRPRAVSLGHSTDYSPWLCGNQPASWDVGAELQKSLARSNRNRFG
jgi:hypothetical protein